MKNRGESIKKQAFSVKLIVLAAVFALLLCGAVSAEDSQEGSVFKNKTLHSSLEDDNDIIDPEITLKVNLEHPEALSGNKLPSVTVKDSDGNLINKVTVKKSGNYQYKVNFLSDKKSFKLTVGAGGHVYKTVNVPVSQKNPSDPVLYGDATVTLRAYNLLIISSSETYVQNFIDSYKKLKKQGYYFNLYYFGLDEVTDTAKQKKIRAAANKADIIALQMIGTSSKDIIKNLISASPAKKILGIRSSNLNIPGIDLNDTVTKQYWVQGGEENIKRFQLYILQSAGMKLKTGENVTVVKWPDQVVYHPKATSKDTSVIGGIPLFLTWNEYLKWYKSKGLYKNAPWVGIVAYDSSIKGGNSQIQVELLKSLESKGLNVILIFATTTGRLNLAKMFFKDKNNKTRIDALVTSLGFTYVSGNSTKSIEIFKDLNVPIFAPVYTSDLEGWGQNSTGISSEVYWQIAQPELEGRIEPVLMGGIEEVGIDKETGIVIKRYKALPDRINRVSERVKNWIALRTLKNSEKKLALIYYNSGGGKDGVSASYLDVVGSIDNIIKSLKKAGYNVPANFSSKNIVNLMLNSGNNVGSWASGELEKVVKAGAITIPLSTYLKWFNSLPKTLRDEVIKEWGPAPGKVMVYNNSIVIPGVILGNLFLGAQPMRGWGEDPEKIKHSPSLPPTHQYIAYYLWLQKYFKANAVIHLGTHGTLEWLPGRSVGLGEDDWPDVLLGNMPNIYPYIVENPGEGTQAKRRSYAVIISHMIPPMVLSGLYGDLASLSDQIKFYHDATTAQRKSELKSIMIKMIKKLNLDEELQINLKSANFNEVVDQVEHYLEELSKTMMPYGLHIFGKPLEGNLLEQMIDSIVSFDPAKRDNKAFRADLRQKLKKNYEMENLLKALNGEYVQPSLAGSPIRKTDVIPTGMNFYSFDPRYAPDQASWEIGKKMADDLLKDFYQKNKHYPETVGVVLWSIETMRTNGQTIAMILRLMGLEPTYSASGYFNGTKVTPLSELNRPRVDVIVTISGLFRDTFSYTIELLDDAFRSVSKLNENTKNNYVRKHYLQDLARYKKMGMNAEDAELYAMARIFGPPSEAYGTGVSEMVPTTSGWVDQSDLVDTYLLRMSYFYGRNINAKSGLDAFITQLKRIEATVQIRDGLYGVLDNDDVYQYLGGLTMAAKSLSGRNVQAYIANTRGTPKIETLSSFISNEFRTRLLNPKWAEGMLKNGFSGAHEITKNVENMFGWNAVDSGLVKDWVWQEVVETYVFNSQMRNKLLAANPHAFKSMAAWALEAARRGMWNPDAATLTQLKDLYIKANIEYGVTCCHHTCGNMNFNKYVVMGSSLSKEMIQQFSDIMQAATGEPVTAGSTGTNSEPTSSASSNGASASSGASSAGDQPASATETGSQSSSESASSSESTGSEGSSKSYEVSENKPSSGESSTPLIAIVGVLCLVGLVGFGYFRGKK